MRKRFTLLLSIWEVLFHHFSFKQLPAIENSTTFFLQGKKKISSKFFESFDSKSGKIFCYKQEREEQEKKNYVKEKRERNV